jgi:phospholipid/cholesterol/gamma-HCH transport system permease protein
MTAGSIQFIREGETLMVRASGDWVIGHARSLQSHIDAARKQLATARRVVLNGESVGSIDTSGAWMLQQIWRDAEAEGRRVEIKGFRDADFALVEQLSEVGEPDIHCEGVRCYTFGDQLVRLGSGVHQGLSHLVDAITFLGRVFATAFRCFGRPTRVRFPAIVANMHRAGVNAIPIVALVSFLVAIVLAYQGATQLQRFGAEIFTVQLTSISMLREMGVLVTAILVAGRTGSAYTAEIGVMKVNEEIDAMQTMGLDPYEVLVLPRVIALVIMLPLLTLVADAAGLAGAALSVTMILDLPLAAFFANAQESITLSHFWSGMIKAPVFAFLIATTATFWGMQVAESADSVGRLTTVSVVQSIFLVIVTDAVFSLIYLNLGI